MDELIALFSGNSPNSLWLYLGLVAVFTVFGLYLSRRGVIVMYANYTDVLCTIMALLLPSLLLVFLGDYNLSLTAKIVIFLIPSLIVAKATFSYNSCVLGFLIALVSKFVLVIAYLLALIAVFVLVMGGERKKYERKKSHSTRQVGQAIAGAVGTTVVFGMLVRLGLHSPGFISLSLYISGKWAEDVNANHSEESRQVSSRCPTPDYGVENDGKEKMRGIKASPKKSEGRKKSEKK